MSLALFDLDNTLLDGDSDRLWNEYLAARGVLDVAAHGERLEAFHRQYLCGTLEVREYLSFSLGLLSGLSADELPGLLQGFMRQMIEPRMSSAAKRLLQVHRAAGHTLLIITLTNRFITEPIAAAFDVDDLLATVPEMHGGKPTGQIIGEPCYQHGKLSHLRAWMQAHGKNLEDSYFYSDSLNDLPLLEAVSCPVVVNPDEELARIARDRGWKILTLSIEDAP